MAATAYPEEVFYVNHDVTVMEDTPAIPTKPHALTALSAIVAAGKQNKAKVFQDEFVVRQCAFAR